MALYTIEICAGVGMLGEGLRAGLTHLGHAVRPVCYLEREAYPAASLAARIEEGSLDAAPIWSDLLTFDAGRWAGAVDGIVAGFPCQDLSLAGKRAGLDGKRSGLFFDILDIADASGAWFLFLENVAGIASATASVVDEAEGALEERAAARVVGELADRGWHTEWLTLSASEVGASHGRERWFCFAWRQSMDDAGRVQRCEGHEQDRPTSTEARGDETNDRPPNRDGLLGNTQSQRRGETRPSDPPAQHARSGGAMAHASGEGQQGRELGTALHGNRGGEETHGPVEQLRRPLFAPGPADTSWPGIIQQWPHLAPALPGPSGGNRLNPCFAENLMGWPIFWTHINVEQTGDQKAGAARNTAAWREVLQMQLRDWFDEAPRGLQQDTGCRDYVSFMPCEASRGRTGNEADAVPDMRVDVHTNKDGEICDLQQPGMPQDTGEAVGSEAMGKPGHEDQLRLLPDHIHKDQAAPDDVWPLLWKQARMAEEAMSTRAQRLKCVGNGVVAACAAAAFVQLARRAGFSG